METKNKIDLKKELMIVKAIDKVFTDNKNKIIPKGEYILTDPACVALIHAKSEDAKRILLRFLNVSEDGSQERENFNIEYKKSEEISSSRYSIDYLKKIMKIFEYDEAVKITIGKDMPITIENEDFKVILAPRIEDE